MSIQRRSKWQQKKKRSICHKFKAVEKTREQTAAFWDNLALPKVIKIQHKPKIKTRIQTDKQYSQACREVDERDNHTCQHPNCNCRIIQHHHGRFRSRGGQDRVEELVGLCWRHHTGSKDSPHQSEEWRKYWVEWLTKRYPEYWAGVREKQKIRHRA